jgi:hypothetical protein
MKGAVIDFHAVVSKLTAIFLEDPERKEESFRTALKQVFDLFFSGFFLTDKQHPVFKFEGYKLLNDTLQIDMDYADFIHWYYKQVDESQGAKVQQMINTLLKDVKDRILSTEESLHKAGKELVLGSEFTTQYMSVEGAWYDANTTIPIYNLTSNYVDTWQNVSDQALSQNLTKMDLPLNQTLEDDDEFDGHESGSDSDSGEEVPLVDHPDHPLLSRDDPDFLEKKKKLVDQGRW